MRPVLVPRLRIRGVKEVFKRVPDRCFLKADANGLTEMPPEKNADCFLEQVQRRPVSINIPARAYPHKNETATAIAVVAAKCLRTLWDRVSRRFASSTLEINSSAVRWICSRCWRACISRRSGDVDAFMTPSSLRSVAKPYLR